MTGNFTAAQSFCGSVDGYKYATGELGTGYYDDPKPPPPTQICLAEIRPTAPIFDMTVGGAQWSKRRTNPNGTRHRGGRPLAWKQSVAFGGGTTEDYEKASRVAIPMGAQATHVEIDDQWPQKAGLWSIDSSNANSWESARTVMAKSSADIELLQELKVHDPQTLMSAVSAAKHEGWKLRPTLAHKTAADLGTGGVAVACRKHIGIIDNTELLVPEGLRHRICVSHIGAICKGGIHFISLWLRHTEGLSEENLMILYAVAKILTKIKGVWIIGGDWNITPAVLTASKWLHVVGGYLAAPQANTCHGSTYDFFVTHQDLKHDVVSVARVEGAGIQPHFPARLTVRGDGRRRMIQTVVRPTKVPGAVPFGPRREHVMGDENDDGNITSIDDWLEQARAELREYTTTRYNKVQKAEFRWSPAHATATAANPGATRASGVWRDMASRFKDVLKHVANWSAQGDAIIMRHAKKTYNVAVGSGNNSKDASLVRAWVGAAQQTLVTREAGTLLKLIAIALNQAKKHELIARKVDDEAWRNWARNGAKKKQGGTAPTRRAFQWVRNPAGWTLGKLGQDALEENVPEDTETAELLYADDLIRQTGRLDSEVSRVWSGSMAPLGAQAEIEGTAKQWATLWKEDDEYKVTKWYFDQQPPSPITGEMIREAALSFPIDTGLGADNLAPRAIARLSMKKLDALARLFMECEARGDWDKAVELVLIVLLPKTDGGKRPIGLFPTPCRIWMRIRSTEAKRWERANASDSIYAGPSMGAQRAAWQIAFQAEAAALDTQHYAQSMLDLVKAFEKVPHHLLVLAAIKHKYCLWTLRLTLSAYRMARSIGFEGVYSRLIIACCGITAGSGSATTELRMLLIDMVNGSYVLFEGVRIFLYVDDLTLSVMHKCAKFVSDLLAQVTDWVISFFEKRLELEVSITKSAVVGDTPTMTKETHRKLKTDKVQPRKYC